MKTPGQCFVAAEHGRCCGCCCFCCCCCHRNRLAILHWVGSISDIAHTHTVDRHICASALDTTFFDKPSTSIPLLYYTLCPYRRTILTWCPLSISEQWVQFTFGSLIDECSVAFARESCLTVREVFLVLRFGDIGATDTASVTQMNSIFMNPTRNVSVWSEKKRIHFCGTFFVE